MPKVIDLFAGAGGLSLGASRAGFNVAAAIEIDNNAIASHVANFPNTVHIHKDIMTLSGEDILNQAHINQNELVGIIGGPPCQGFSSIGQGNVDDTRNHLFIKFFDLVSELHPVFFLAENVPGIMNSKYDKIRNEAFAKLEGYTLLEPIEINASEYGAPTTRTRYFFIGFRPGNAILPFDSHDIEQKKVPYNQQTHVQAALEGLQQDIRYTQSNNSYKKLSKDYIDIASCHLQSDFYYQRTTGMIPNQIGNKKYIKEYLEDHVVNGCIPTKHSKEVRARYAKLSYSQQDSISKSKRLDPNGFCPTLRAGTGPDKGSYQAVRPIHYRYNRVITPREAARLQGFPDWYKLPETIWHSFRQIGNSVSPIVAEQVLSAIYQRLIL